MRKRLQIFCLLLLPCLTLMGILGRGSPAALSTSSDAAIPASADNWGLSFPAEHETPIGNATADFLTQYDAWYVGDTSQKVIYLTFDCGYENGNTGAILDALKKHSAPAAFFVVGHMIESAPDIVTTRICPPFPTRPASKRSWILWRRCIRRPPDRNCPTSTGPRRGNTVSKT